jgi:hypothetical protein
MKWINAIWVVLIIFALMTGVFFVIRFYLHKEVAIAQEKCRREFSLTILALDNLTQEKMILLENENCLMDSNIVVLNFKNEKIGLETIISQQTVCCYISSSFCKNCVDYCLGEIKDYVSKNPDFKIIIFASGYLIRDLFVFAKDNGFDTNFIYSVDTFGFPIDKIQMPYFFILDKNLHPNHFFVPRKELDELTKQYLSKKKAYK